MGCSATMSCQIHLWHKQWNQWIGLRLLLNGQEILDIPLCVVCILHELVHNWNSNRGSKKLSEECPAGSLLVLNTDMCRAGGISCAGYRLGIVMLVAA